MKPLPPPLDRPSEPIPRLFFTTARRREMAEHVSNYLAVDDGLPDAETYHDRFCEAHEIPPSNIGAFSVSDALPDFHVRTVRRLYRRKQLVVFGMVFWGWEKVE